MRHRFRAECGTPPPKITRTWLAAACFAIFAVSAAATPPPSDAAPDPVILPFDDAVTRTFEPTRLAQPEAARGGTYPTGPGYTVSFTPYSTLPTEDVDLVEVASAIGPIGVWPNEGVVHFMDITTPLGSPPAPIISLPTVGPNITGVDFVAEPGGAMGAHATLGFLHLFDLTVFPPAITASVALPGTPARRDIDPIIVAGGAAVIYATGTEIHCVSYPGGGILWTLPLPSPVVEAVDPVVNTAETRLIIPTEGFVTIYDISVLAAPAFVASHFLGTTLVREVDARLAVGETICYMPAKGVLFAFDMFGGVLAAIPLASPLIEGNDMEIDPTGTYGFLPTLAFMYQIDLPASLVFATHSFTGFVHQRNIDAIFSDPVAGPPLLALYPVQGAAFVYDVFGGFISGLVPTPGTLIDGVDAALTDTAAPPGYTAVLSTLGFTHIIDMLGGGVATIPTPGTLRMDVDPKPGPLGANRILQPSIGGVTQIDGFGPDDWVVSTGGGLWVVDVAAGAALGFVPTPLIYRGGDAQPTFTLPGPLEPPYSVDDPDQDFLTKCWEYKFATHRWPYWYSYSADYGPYSFYPHWVPFGVFGPPPLAGYDLLNHVKVVVTDVQELVLLNEQGFAIQVIALPARPIGGLIWDWDNKHCKIRLEGQLEAIVDLSKIPTGGAAGVSFVAYGDRSHWFPIVDRMNGWEFVVLRGGKRVWVYDHLNGALVTILNLPARVIRRPVFDAQRKTLVMPLADRRAAFFSAWRYQLGLPDYLYYTPYLGRHIVGSPVFDLYNHMVLFKLHGGQIAVCDIDYGSILWDSGPLPYWPISPFRVDCYNKIGKGYFRDAAFNYYEMHLNLYPLVQGLPPVLNWLPLAGRPWGYPWFDSKDGYEFARIGDFDIAYNYLFNPFAGGVITTPFPMIGNVFFDRVNKYGLVRLRDPGGGGLLFYMDLYRVTNGLAPATQLIPWPDQFEDDIVFDTQGHYAVAHTSTGGMVFIDMREAVLTHSTGPGFPKLNRQLFALPFRHLVNYTYDDPVFGGVGDLTFDLSPIRWDPPIGVAPDYNPYSAYVNFIGSGPLEATDFTPPPALDVALIQQVGPFAGDEPGLLDYELLPGAAEPGAVVQAHNRTTYETDLMDEPTEDVAEDDGSGLITVVGDPGDELCFKVYDSSGNAGPPVCITVPVGVDGEVVRTFAFALVGGNPVTRDASFAFTLPEAGHAELAIYDVTGRMVRSVRSERLEAGEYTWSWDLTDGHRPVESGVYFAAFKAGTHEAGARLVVVR